MCQWIPCAPAWLPLPMCSRSVVVVSAFAGETDRLLARARQLGAAPALAVACVPD